MVLFMNLKRIIREEMDQFDWIRDINPIDLDREVKDYVDKGYVVAIWFGEMNEGLRQYIKQFTEKEGFSWGSNEIGKVWKKNGDVLGLTFYPNGTLGGFSGPDAKNKWDSYHREVEAGEYNDIDSNKFHSIEI